MLRTILVLLLTASSGIGIFHGGGGRLLPLLMGKFKFFREFVEFGANEMCDIVPSDREEYDFIVVGAGSAGSVLASRLSEIEDAKVLLIEAGGHEFLVHDIPIFALHLYFNKAIHWDYETETSDKYCLGKENRRCKVPIGKVMGGTSTLNFMIATRGNKKDYDDWEKLTGDPEWSYEGMLKYFKKMEYFDVSLAKVDDAYHGYEGPVRVSNVPYRTKLVEAFVKAGEELGLPSLDYNGEKQTGFSYMQTNQIYGERLSANRAYLHPARDRENLFVSMNSHATKILIDPTTKIARGVRFTKYEKFSKPRKFEVYARKEVILCAGAVNTPKLLMLSGIGPADHLKSLNVNVLQDAPVGENLADHIGYGGLTFLVNDTVSFPTPDVLNLGKPHLNEYLWDRSGPASAPGAVEALGYVNVDDPKADNETPNVELLFSSIHLGQDESFHLPFGITKKHWYQSFADGLNKPGWLIWPIVMKPKSRGKVLLGSSDPRSKPRLLMNYLSDPEDVRLGVEGIRWAIKVAKTRAMQAYGSELLDNVVPGCECLKRDSDEYWECALRTYTMTFWHFCGTAKMGRENDSSAVVNTRLQVKGIKRLRVGDASVMPDIPTAHINLPVMAVAEKLADMIKSDWGYVQRDQ